MATVQSLFNLPGRQTQGFLESLFALKGIDLPVPDHSTLSASLQSPDLFTHCRQIQKPAMLLLQAFHLILVLFVLDGVE